MVFVLRCKALPLYWQKSWGFGPEKIWSVGLDIKSIVYIMVDKMWLRAYRAGTVKDSLRQRSVIAVQSSDVANNPISKLLHFHYL